MGLGDDLLFLGEAEKVYKKTGQKITPIHGKGWSPLFDNVEFLVKTGGLTMNARDTNKLSSIHVDYYEQGKYNNKIVYRAYEPKPFRLRLTDEEKLFAQNTISKYNIPEEFFIVNPDYKVSFFNDNKNWGFDKFQELTNRLSEKVQVVRVHPGGKYKEPDLDNAINIKCPNVRNFSALLSHAKAAVGFEGLVNHMTAGFGIPMVVICGGLVSSKSFGYPTSTYIEYDHPLTPCGSMNNCSHCKEANNSITVDEVYDKCLKYL